MTEEEKRLANNAACKRWREKNADYEKLRQAKYYLENTERVYAKNKRWRANNRDKLLELSKKYYQQSKSRDIPSNKLEYRMWWNAKKRATKKGFEFTLDREDIKIPDSCPCCGGSMESPSVDRVHNNLGYTKDNVAVICRRCNMVKNEGDAELHRKIADFIDNFNPHRYLDRS